MHRFQTLAAIVAAVLVAPAAASQTLLPPYRIGMPGLGHAARRARSSERLATESV